MTTGARGSIGLPPCAAMLVAACATSACGGRAHLAGEFPGQLAAAPLILVDLEGGGVTDWQIERDESIVEELASCLPAAIASLCDGSCEVRRADSTGTLEPHLVLEVTTSYSSSAHFTMGFVLGVRFSFRDRASTEDLGAFGYTFEPLDKVMAEEGSDLDEVLTYEASKAAGTFCEDVAREAAELAMEKEGAPGGGEGG